MGIFDVSIKKTNHSKTSLETFKETLTSSSQEVSSDQQSLTAHFYKPKGSLLTYHLTITKEHNELFIEGELQGVIYLVVLIVLGILFTYGVGVILVAGYAYLQKKTAEKELNLLIERLE